MDSPSCIKPVGLHPCSFADGGVDDAGRRGTPHGGVDHCLPLIFILKITQMINEM